MFQRPHLGTLDAVGSRPTQHCPKCQGAAARTWLAAREADLLPVGYFHVVFTVPAEIADIAWQNKAVVHDLLFRAAADTMLTIRERQLRNRHRTYLRREIAGSGMTSWADSGKAASGRSLNLSCH